MSTVAICEQFHFKYFETSLPAREHRFNKLTQQDLAKVDSATCQKG